MAIRRCPYCKAIIDESQKYCNNCGTQLLFPQDEEIEEDIKGEKIRDDDFRDEEPPEVEEEEAVKEEIDLEKILEGAAPFPDDLGGSETDEIEPTPSEPIVKPIPKPLAASKPKVPQKPEPVVESKPAAKPKPAPQPPAPSREPEVGPAPTKAEKPLPDVPAAPPAEIKSENARREASGEADDSAAGESLFAEAREREPEPKPEAVPEAEEHVSVLERPEESGESAGAEVGEEDEEAYGLEEGNGRKDEDIGADEIEDIEDRDEPADAEESEEAEIDQYLRGEEGSTAGTEEVKPVSPVVLVRPAGPLEEDLDVEDKDAAEDEEHPDVEAGTEAEEDRDEAGTREEIARLIAALEKKHKKIPLSREEKKIIAPLEETSGLPAWAESSRTTKVAKTEDEDDAGMSGGGRSFAPGDTMDFEEEVMRDAGRNESKPTIGIPETLSKIEIPGQAEEDKEDREEVEEEVAGKPRQESKGERDESAEEAESEPLPTFVFRKRLGFFGVLRAGIYDFLFVALLWFGAVWLAAQILTLPVQTLILQAAVPLGLFFGVLLLGYLFLFLFFLGETLGGRLVASKR